MMHLDFEIKPEASFDTITPLNVVFFVFDESDFLIQNSQVQSSAFSRPRNQSETLNKNHMILITNKYELWLLDIFFLFQNNFFLNLLFRLSHLICKFSNCLFCMLEKLGNSPKKIKFTRRYYFFENSEFLKDSHSKRS
jgi:hypothetical protein